MLACLLEEPAFHKWRAGGPATRPVNVTWLRSYVKSKHHGGKTSFFPDTKPRQSFPWDPRFPRTRNYSSCRSHASVRDSRWTQRLLFLSFRCRGIWQKHHCETDEVSGDTAFCKTALPRHAREFTGSLPGSPIVTICGFLLLPESFTRTAIRRKNANSIKSLSTATRYSPLLPSSAPWAG